MIEGKEKNQHNKQLFSMLHFWLPSRLPLELVAFIFKVL